MAELYPINQRFAGDGNLYVRFIDVGLGDCTYIQCPNGKRLLIDAGSTNRGNIGIGNIQQQLDYDPATNHLRADVLVVSHGHQDHYNLLRHLVGASSIQYAYFGGPLNSYNGYEFRLWWHNQANVGRAVTLNVNQASPNIIEICDGTVANGTACRVEVLAATVAPTTSQTYQWIKNTYSIVVRITFGNDVIIIPGDATIDTEAFIIGTFGAGALRANNLRVPHHGSETSSSQAFVNAVQPEYAIISCKDQNRHGLPKRYIVNRYINGNTLNGNQQLHYIGAYGDNNGANPRNYNPLNNLNINIWQTGVSGTMTGTFNGQ